MREGEFAHLHPELLGDVVISAETAAREARELSQSVEERIDFLLVHGILHLLGYDHEKSERDMELMEDKSNELMESIYPSSEGRVEVF